MMMKWLALVGLTILLLLVSFLFVNNQPGHSFGQRDDKDNLSSYKERSEVMRRMCAVHREELELRYKVFRPLKSYDKVIEDVGAIFYEKTRPCFFCLHGKSGTSSLIAVLAREW